MRKGIKGMSFWVIPICLIFTLIGCSSLTTTEPTEVQTSKAMIEPTVKQTTAPSKIKTSSYYKWKVAYKKFLTEKFESSNPKLIIQFSFKDMDNNGTPELLILKNGVDITVYTYNNKLVKIGSRNFGTGTTRLLYSKKSLYPGVFFFFAGGGMNHYGCLTIKDKKAKYKELWNEDYSGISKALGLNRGRINEFSSDKKFIEESRKVYKEKNDLKFKRFKQNKTEPIPTVIQSIKPTSSLRPVKSYKATSSDRVKEIRRIRMGKWGELFR